jgi:hypothetical protein
MSSRYRRASALRHSHCRRGIAPHTDDSVIKASLPCHPSPASLRFRVNGSHYSNSKNKTSSVSAENRTFKRCPSSLSMTGGRLIATSPGQYVCSVFQLERIEQRGDQEQFFIGRLGLMPEVQRHLQHSGDMAPRAPDRLPLSLAFHATREQPLPHRQGVTSYRGELAAIFQVRAFQQYVSPGGLRRY